MDYSKSPIRKHPQKYNSKRLTQEQICLLEASFSFNNKLDSDRKLQLSQELGLPPRQIAIWYQNKRARWKNQSLEVEYKTLEKKLQSVLFDNERLGREIERLKQELDKAKQMLISINYGGYNSSIPSISNSCDEVGTSISLEKYDHYHLDKDLFACFIGGQGRFDKPGGDEDIFNTRKY